MLILIKIGICLVIGGNLDIEIKKPPIMCGYVLYPVIDVNGSMVLCCKILIVITSWGIFLKDTL